MAFKNCVALTASGTHFFYYLGNAIVSKLILFSPANRSSTATAPILLLVLFMGSQKSVGTTQAPRYLLIEIEQGSTKDILPSEIIETPSINSFRGAIKDLENIAKVLEQSVFYAGGTHVRNAKGQR